MANDLQSKVDAIRERLAAIDPRFEGAPKPHPLAKRVEEGPQAVDDLLATAEDVDAGAEAQLRALEAVGAILSEHGTSGPIAARLATLGANPNVAAEVGAAAVRALMLSRHPKFIAAFQGRLASDDPPTAAAAAHAMGVARHKESAAALRELLVESESVEVRAQAAWALGEIGDADSLELLRAAFKAQEVLLPVIGALGRLGVPEDLAELTVALRDAATEVRFAAADAIAEIVRRHEGADHDALSPYLKNALEKEDEPLVGVVLIACLSRIEADIPRDQIERVLGVNFGDAAVKAYLAKLLTKKR